MCHFFLSSSLSIQRRVFCPRLQHVAVTSGKNRRPALKFCASIWRKKKTKKKNVTAPRQRVSRRPASQLPRLHCSTCGPPFLVDSPGMLIRAPIKNSGTQACKRGWWWWWGRRRRRKKKVFTAGGCNASRAVGSEGVEILHSLPFQVDTGAPSHKSTEGSSHKSTRLSRS